MLVGVVVVGVVVVLSSGSSSSCCCCMKYGWSMVTGTSYTNYHSCVVPFGLERE